MIKYAGLNKAHASYQGEIKAPEIRHGTQWPRKLENKLRLRISKVAHKDK